MKVDLTQLEGHTPGPWSLDDPEYSGHQNVLPKYTLWHRENYDISGETGTGLVTSSAQTVAYIRAQEKNAALIAAAPDLLAYARELEARNKELEKFVRRAFLAGLYEGAPEAFSNREQEAMFNEWNAEHGLAKNGGE